ncbi:MAG: PaaI family thioesterase [Acetobacteraceae bacterium]|nr:PaaI family thioesterase [Acetobacteraceae bacterium]
MNLLGEIAPGLPGMEQLRMLLQSGKRPGMAETLDIRLAEVGDGWAVLEATPDSRVYNPLGTVHGGFAATVLDFACGYAVLSKMQAGRTFSTVEIKVAYHRAISDRTGTVRGEGKVVTLGRRAAFTEARLTGRDGTLYASATSSLLITGEAPR